MLHYRKGEIKEYVFRDLPKLLPGDALMVYNDTKVVPARLLFQRESGAHIEVFCLEPLSPSDYNISFASRESCSWKCVIGNAKKWKGDVLHLYNPDADENIARMGLEAVLLGRDGQSGEVLFRWKDGSAFSEVLERGGRIPIPPYLNRES